MNDDTFFKQFEASNQYGCAYGACDFGAVTEQGTDDTFGGVAEDLRDQLGAWLGGAATETASAMMQDPEVQQQIQNATLQCKTKAKEGVTEWMGENWHLLALGGGVLLVGHWGLTTLALALAFPKSAFK